MLGGGDENNVFLQFPCKVSSVTGYVLMGGQMVADADEDVDFVGIFLNIAQTDC